MIRKKDLRGDYSMAVSTVHTQTQNYAHQHLHEVGPGDPQLQIANGDYTVEHGLNDSNGYDTEESDTAVGYDPLDEETPVSRAPFSSISVNVHSGSEDGPDGYIHFGAYPVIDHYISASPGRSALINAFTLRHYSYQTKTWAYNALHALGSHFGRVDVSSLGNGNNSCVFVMQQESSQSKQVLRVFPISRLRNVHFTQGFQLHRDHVGGEWLSVTVNHPNLANNSHIIAWDSADNSFKVMTREEVQHLVDNHHNLEEGRRIYAVGTIGNYVEGSRDLAKVIQDEHRFSEKALRPILCDIFEGIVNLNGSQVVHRDLKAANVIVLPSGQAQIIDFGNAGVQKGDQALDVFGDRCYHPPESNITISGTPPHTSKKTDSFGLFLLTYHAITGESFYGVSQNNINVLKFEHLNMLHQQQSKSFRKILEDDPKLAHVSPTLKDLMAHLGTANKAERMTAEQAMTHPFFLSHYLVNRLDTTI
jgi:hypothetical protein